MPINADIIAAVAIDDVPDGVEQACRALSDLHGQLAALAGISAYREPGGDQALADAMVTLGSTLTSAIDELDQVLSQLGDVRRMAHAVLNAADEVRRRATHDEGSFLCPAPATEAA